MPRSEAQRAQVTIWTYFLYETTTCVFNGTCSTKHLSSPCTTRKYSAEVCLTCAARTIATKATARETILFQLMPNSRQCSTAFSYLDRASSLSFFLSFVLSFFSFFLSPFFLSFLPSFLLLFFFFQFFRLHFFYFILFIFFVPPNFVIYYILFYFWIQLTPDNKINDDKCVHVYDYGSSRLR